MLESKINRIIKNLTDNTPINYASCSLIRDGRSIFQFMTDDKWSNFYSKNKLFESCPLAQASFGTKDSSTMILPWNKAQAKTKDSRDILLSRRFFNQNYGVTIVNSYESGIKEAFVFASAQEIDFLKIIHKSVLIQRTINQISFELNRPHTI